MIARFQGFHAGPDVNHHTRAFVAKDRGEGAFGVCAGQGEFIGVADAGGLDFNQNLTLFRAFKVHVHHFQRFSGL
jgi:hypothetical protein